MPVDLYVGGAEHAVLHLLYARFWHMVLYDAGVVTSPEPFAKLVHQGMILGELEYTAYRIEQTGAWVSAADTHEGVDTRSGHAVTPVRVDEEAVRKQGDDFVLRDDPSVRLEVRAHKMSKSRGNVVNPDEIIAEYGADAFRLYEMFMGPLEQVKPWNTRGVSGTYRFLNRTWRLLSGERKALVDTEPARTQWRMLHQTLQRVTQDIEALRMNTAIAALMEFVNAAYRWEAVPRQVAAPFVLMLSPFAPHMAEALWERLGHTGSLAYEPWPAVNEDFLVEDTMTIPVQINGKVRATIDAPADASRQLVLELARKEGKVRRFLDGKTVRKEIYVHGRIVNFVAA